MSTLNFKTLIDEFSAPPREFSPAPIWWWSGEPLEPERLRFQMERFAEGGVFNLVILNLAPTGPLYGSDPDSPAFLSEAWWAIFEGVCQDAQKLKIRLWFYDQIGFSGANFQGQVVAQDKSFAGESLESVTAEGPGVLKLSMPAEGKALGAAVWPLEGGAAKAVAVKNGVARHQGSKPSRLRLFYSVKRGFDYFNPKACQALIGKVHGQFEARAKKWFGKVIAGSFQDELPNVPNWGPSFAAEFKRIKGYDLIPKLASLWEGDAPADMQVRLDYQFCRSLLQEEAFFKPLFYWHEKHGLLCGVDQQGDARSGNPSDGVRIYADYMRTHRWFGAPGSDQHGETKIHSSLAHLYKRERVWIESFHSSGWGGTLEETFDWLMPWIRAGATLYNPHAAYYSTKGGWYEWAPPSTCWRQPYWKHYPEFAGAVARLCRLLSRGRHLAQVALLFPNAACQAGTTMQGEGPKAKAAKDSYKALVGHMFFNQPVPGALDRDCRDFDILDDDSVAKAQIDASGLSVAGETYQAMILPSCSVLEEATLEKLVAFAKAGNLLISLGSRPEWVMGKGGVKKISSLKNIPHAETPEDLPRLLKGLKRQVEAPVTTLRRKFEGSDIVFVPAIYPRATRRSETGGWDPFTYDFDTEAYAKEMTLLVRGVKGQPELWDPFTGKRSKLKAVPAEDGMRVSLPLDQGPAALLVWPPAPSPALLAPARPRKQLLQLEGTWDSALVPTLDNRYGDFDRPKTSGSPDLQSWHFMHRIEKDAENGLTLGWTKPQADESAFKEVKAGYGIFGWQSAVQDTIWSPDPLPADWASQGQLDARGFKPTTYSLSRGIDLDRIHFSVLGAKGHVPEEFISFGKAKSGQCGMFRTSFSLPKAQSLTLAIGGRGAKAVWLDGKMLKDEEAEEGYLCYLPLKLAKGVHVLEFRLRALEQDGDLRATWALLKDKAAFVRPEWMKAPGAPKKDSRVTFSVKLNLNFDPQGAKIQIAADAPLCRLLVNGVEAGRQGGFDPYGNNFRVMPYPSQAFKKGQNVVSLEMLDSGSDQVCALVDGIVEGKNGKSVAILSGTHWSQSRDGAPQSAARPFSGPVFWGGKFWPDPAWYLLQRRPHFLPGAMWIEDKLPSGAVLDLAPNAYPGAKRVEWLRWMLPSGATSMHLPLKDGYRLWVDGKELKSSKGSLKLPNPKLVSRKAVIRVEAKSGPSGGALFSHPVTYSMGPGTLNLGNWREQGLRSYSGGMKYRKTFKLSKLSPSLEIDLGRVRGTAEVALNGQPLGARFLSPYKFEMGKAAKKGSNVLEVTVYNTLAPYLRSTSPTHYVFPGQEDSGIFGPVVIKG